MAVRVIVDILVVLLAIIGIVAGIRQGFVRLLFQRFRRLSAALIALLISKPLGALITKGFLSDKLTGFIMSAAKLKELPNAASPEELLESVPVVVRWIAQGFHYDLAAAAQRAFEEGDGMYYTVIKELSYPLASTIAVVLSWIALYFLLRLTIRLLLRITDGLFDLPVIKQINCILGACLGLLFNAAIVWCACRVFVWVITLPAFANVSALQSFSIDSTYIAKYVYYFNPLAFILSINPNR